MSKQKFTGRAEPEKKMSSKAPEQVPDIGVLDEIEPGFNELISGPYGALGSGSQENQANLLGNHGLLDAQRQRIGSRIGQVQGNRRMQSLMGALRRAGDGDQGQSSLIQRSPEDGAPVVEAVDTKALEETAERAKENTAQAEVVSSQEPVHDSQREVMAEQVKQSNEATPSTGAGGMSESAPGDGRAPLEMGDEGTSNRADALADEKVEEITAEKGAAGSTGSASGEVINAPGMAEESGKQTAGESASGREEPPQVERPVQGMEPGRDGAAAGMAGSEPASESTLENAGPAERVIEETAGQKAKGTASGTEAASGAGSSLEAGAGKGATGEFSTAGEAAAAGIGGITGGAAGGVVAGAMQSAEAAGTAAGKGFAGAGGGPVAEVGGKASGGGAAGAATTAEAAGKAGGGAAGGGGAGGAVGGKSAGAGPSGVAAPASEKGGPGPDTSAAPQGGGPSLMVDDSGMAVGSGGGDGMSALSTGDLSSVDEELAEHERWAGAKDTVGAAGSDQRAAFIAQQAGEGLLTGFAQGAAMGVVTGLAGQALNFIPIPGVGAIFAGAMSAYGLATRDWKATGETLSKFGEGSDIYEKLANDIAAIAEIIDLAVNIMNIVAGILGIISAAMWIITIITVGVAAPLATTLSVIALEIVEVSSLLGLINSLVLQPVVMLFRAMHTFTSQADPRDVQAQGGEISKAAGAAGGALGGLAGGALAEGMTATPEEPTAPTNTEPVPEPVPPAEGDGPTVKFTEPETPPSGGSTEPSTKGESDLGTADTQPMPAAAPETPEGAPPSSGGPESQPASSTPEGENQQSVVQAPGAENEGMNPQGPETTSADTGQMPAAQGDNGSAVVQPPGPENAGMNPNGPEATTADTGQMPAQSVPNEPSGGPPGGPGGPKNPVMQMPAINEGQMYPGAPKPPGWDAVPVGTPVAPQPDPFQRMQMPAIPEGQMYPGAPQPAGWNPEPIPGTPEYAPTPSTSSPAPVEPPPAVIQAPGPGNAGMTPGGPEATSAKTGVAPAAPAGGVAPTVDMTGVQPAQPAPGGGVAPTVDMTGVQPAQPAPGGGVAPTVDMTGVQPAPVNQTEPMPGAPTVPNQTEPMPGAPARPNQTEPMPGAPPLPEASPQGGSGKSPMANSAEVPAVPQPENQPATKVGRNDQAPFPPKDPINDPFPGHDAPPMEKLAWANRNFPEYEPAQPPPKTEPMPAPTPEQAKAQVDADFAAKQQDPFAHFVYEGPPPDMDAMQKAYQSGQPYEYNAKPIGQGGSSGGPSSVTPPPSGNEPGPQAPQNAPESQGSQQSPLAQSTPTPGQPAPEPQGSQTSPLARSVPPPAPENSALPGAPAGNENLTGMRIESIGTPPEGGLPFNEADIEAWGNQIPNHASSESYFEMDANALQDIQARPNPNPNQIGYNVNHYLSDVENVRIANASDVFAARAAGAERGPYESVIPEGVGVNANPTPNTTLTNPDGSPVLNTNGQPIGNQNIELRYHSANPTAPAGSYSNTEPTVQVNSPSDRFGWAGNRDTNVNGETGRYLTPDGRWVTMRGGTSPADRAAVHYPVGTSTNPIGGGGIPPTSGAPGGGGGGTPPPAPLIPGAAPVLPPSSTPSPGSTTNLSGANFKNSLERPQAQGSEKKQTSGGGAPKVEKKDEGPKVERVNPEYTDPPGTPEQLAQVKNEIVNILGARAKAEAAEKKMAAEEQKHQANQAPIQQAVTETQGGISATDAHKQAVANKEAANKQQQQKQGESQSTVGSYASKATGMEALRVPLRAFQGFTHIASELPGDVGASMQKMAGDADHLENAFQQMDLSMQKQVESQPQQAEKLQGDAQTLELTGNQADKAHEDMVKANQGADALQQANTQKVTQARAAKAEASQQKAQLEEAGNKKQAQAQTLADQLQAWAQQHAAARKTAMEETKKKLEGEGKQVVE